MTYDNTDKEILKMLQKDLPITSRPYKRLADRLQISESEVAERIRSLQEKGIIRRLGAVLRHQKVGYTVNAMVAWKIEEARADQAGVFMASFPEISHCYFREVPEEFPYPLFTMIHARNEEQLLHTIRTISEQLGLSDFLVIKSIRELKKTSMQYL